MVRYNLVELSDKTTPINDPDSKVKIIDVWKHNLDREMLKIINLVEKYPCIAMVCTLDGFGKGFTIRLLPIPTTT